MLFNLSATSDYQFIYPAFYKNYSLLISRAESGFYQHILSYKLDKNKTKQK